MRSGESEKREEKRRLAKRAEALSRVVWKCIEARRGSRCHVDASNVALSLKRRLIEEREFVIIKWKWLKSRRHDLVTGH